MRRRGCEEEATEERRRGGEGVSALFGLELEPGGGAVAEVLLLPRIEPDRL